MICLEGGVIARLSLPHPLSLSLHNSDCLVARIHSSSSSEADPHLLLLRLRMARTFCCRVLQRRDLRRRPDSNGLILLVPEHTVDDCNAEEARERGVSLLESLPTFAEVDFSVSPSWINTSVEGVSLRRRETLLSSTILLIFCSSSSMTPEAFCCWCSCDLSPQVCSSASVHSSGMVPSASLLLKVCSRL